LFRSKALGENRIWPCEAANGVAYHCANEAENTADNERKEFGHEASAQHHAGIIERDHEYGSCNRGDAPDHDCAVDRGLIIVVVILIFLVLHVLIFHTVLLKKPLTVGLTARLPS